MKNNRQWHIQTRILTIILILIISLLVMVAVVFNTVLQTYIRSSVESQLDELTYIEPKHDGGASGEPASGEPVVQSAVTESPDPSVPDTSAAESANMQSGEPSGEQSGEPSGGMHGGLPDLSDQKNGRFGTKANAFLLAADYTVLAAADGEDDVAADIAGTLAGTEASLSGIQNVYLSAQTGKYYITTIHYMQQSTEYMVYYVDVTAVMDISGTVNAILVCILLAAVILSLFAARGVAHSLTANVDSLSDYASEIGMGCFDAEKPQFHDIEFNDLANALEDTAGKLSAAQKKQDDFFQNVSHEFRTPLMSIRCYAEGIECGVMNPAESSATILSETDRLSALVEDLLFISRIDGERKVANAEERDLRDTLSLCVAGQRSLAEGAQIRFDFDFDNDPVLFFYNEKDMYQVCSNLISNALRYARSAVTLRCRQDGSVILLSVRDDGAGITPEDLPHIFERFYKGRGGKHGIGLSIVKSVVDLYAGEIGVESDGSGTEFTIKLPCPPEADAGQPEAL